MNKLNKIKLLEGKLICVTGLHIGGGDNGMHIGGTDNPVIKKVGAVSEPYIPGSSLKGKIRSLLELYKGGNEFDSELAQLFGKKAKDNDNKHITSAVGRLSFWDCFLTEEWKQKVQEKDLPYTEVKMENVIDRASGTAQHPRNTERVISGSEFDFKLTIKDFEGDNFENLILTGLKLLELDSLGGSGSRGYGKVRFENLTIDGTSIQSKFDGIKLF